LKAVGLAPDWGSARAIFSVTNYWNVEKSANPITLLVGLPATLVIKLFTVWHLTKTFLNSLRNKCQGILLKNL
jgi:hypothetical protein